MDEQVGPPPAPRRIGRPRIDDRRRKRGLRFRDWEWSKILSDAADADMRVGDYIRWMLGL